MNIWVAASDGLTAQVEELLRQTSADANVKDPNGYTPMHAAAAYGHIDLLRLLIANYHGDVNVRDSDGDTPLHHAEDLQTVRVLLEEFGADPLLVNTEGKTPLAVYEEDAENAELIEYMRARVGSTGGQALAGSEDLADSELPDIDSGKLAEFRESIRYTLENVPADETDPESVQRRQRLEEIMSSDCPEEQLEAYIRDMVRNQFFPSADDANTKRRR
ncbi:AaceriAAR063Cp [[Ashbya] aceris (nom. inval.)]|nr:AaceriAAR063Cp [[Ashbya] aceris (nom. inval.)]